jgi:small subunit ribosomal protein S2
MLHRALSAVRATVSKNGRILFVGTKRQASEEIAAAAKRCGQYYVDNRWLGGMLTNWSTIQNSIRQLRKIEERLAEHNSGLNKKEILTMTRQRDKLERSLGGIRDMGGKPDLLFIIDTNREELAVKEAQKLGIPIVAIIDTNCTVDGIDFPIPGNDDATRAIKLYCQLISDAALAGLADSMGGKEVDFGASLDASEMQATEGLSERQQQEKLTRENNRAGKGGRGKPAPKAAPTSSTKKEAFAAEAKKAAGKKKVEEVPFEAATAAAEAPAEAPKAKKTAKKSA